MKEELKGAKELINIPEVKCGSYSFIGNSNITYADIKTLLDYITQLETNWKELKKWLEEICEANYKYTDYDEVLNKMQEIESGKNE